MTDRPSIAPAPADERPAVERLVDIADTVFARASSLEGMKLGRGQEEAHRIVDEGREAAFRSTVALWRVILSMLPTSGLEQARRKELAMDGYKVMSRACHRLGELEEAERHITRAIDAGYLDGFISLGAVCLDRKDYDAAERAFRSALAKDVQATRAHAGLGELYFAMGTARLKDDPTHKEYFVKAEEEFMIAGKERFTEGYERAMDLFETIGWKEKAAAIGARLAQHYGNNRSRYGEKLRVLDQRIRRLAGERRYEKIVTGVGRRLGDILGGKEPK
jgi:tetratricopeptide (TPR) repeat protein